MSKRMVQKKFDKMKFFCENNESLSSRRALTVIATSSNISFG
jgi:hypothetical protein